MPEHRFVVIPLLTLLCASLHHACTQDPEALETQDTPTTHFASTDGAGVLIEGDDPKECLAYTHYEAKNICRPFISAISTYMLNDPAIKPFYLQALAISHGLSSVYNKVVTDLIVMGDDQALNIEWTFTLPLLRGANTIAFDTFLQRDHDRPCNPLEQAQVLKAHFANPVRQNLINFIRGRLAFYCGTETVVLCQRARYADFN